MSISPVLPTGTLVLVNKYKFCSTYEYFRIRKISISPVVPTSTSVLGICYVVPTGTFVPVKCSVVPTGISVSEIQ